jgi:membrane-bound serine protease (ClpP class)
MIQAILASPVPVAVYVSPSGAHAASAGTYLVYAAHVAAMAPGTSLGAATPIQIGGMPASPRPADKDAKDGAPADGQTTMERKMVNDAVAFLRGLAQLRGRNADWAEKAVRDAATLTADEAQAAKVVDFVAADIPELLAKAHGRTVKVGATEKTLDTRNAPLVTVEKTWRTRLIGLITDPNIAFLLLLVGIYGLIFEFMTPGTYAPGVIGAISLLLALAALSMLPVSIVGIVLLVLGIGLMIAEGVTPGFGAIGIGGVVAFVAGAVFLFDASGADVDFRVAWPVVISAAVTSAALFTALVGAALRSRKRRVVTGDEQLRGERGSVLSWNGLAGTVRIHGEIWSARADVPLTAAEPVEVVTREGLTLIVRPLARTGEVHA